MHALLIFVGFITLQTANAKIFTPYEVEKMGQHLLDTKHFVGATIAVITPGEEFIVHLGETKRGSGTKPTNDSIYEIASVSKALTGTLLAQLIVEGKVQEAASVPSLLGVKKLSKKKQPISVLDLATHSSGIPTIYAEGSYTPKDPLNPWAGFSKKEVYSELRRTDLQFLPGTKYGYSNMGAAVLGYVLEAIDKKSYGEILADRISAPLQLKDTVLVVSADQSKRLVSGYYFDGAKHTDTPKWDMTGVAAAGAVVSTISDMVVLTKSLMEQDSALGKAFDVAVRPRRTVSDGLSVGYFWHIDEKSKFVWHNGATYGASSAIVISKDKKAAVIVLANTYTGKGEETALAFALLTQAVAE